MVIVLNNLNHLELYVNLILLFEFVNCSLLKYFKVSVQLRFLSMEFIRLVSNLCSGKYYLNHYLKVDKVNIEENNKYVVKTISL